MEYTFEVRKDHILEDCLSNVSSMECQSCKADSGMDISVY